MSTANSPAMVTKKGRIFRCGDFPAKGWSCTVEEFAAANGTSGVIPLGFDPKQLNHYQGERNALDGHTGEARWYLQGDEILADVLYPEWMGPIIRENDLKFSAVIGRTSKVIQKADYVDRPHIKDAVLFAEEHDLVVVFEDDEPTEFCDDPEAAEFGQEAHDLAADLMPHLCDPGRPVQFADQGEHEHTLMLIHDMAVHHGHAECPGMNAETDEEIEMADDNDYDFEQAVVSFSDDQLADLDPRDARAVRQERTIRRMTAEADRKDAVAFAEEMAVGENARVRVFEKDNIIHGFLAASRRARETPDAITFTDGGKQVQGSPLDEFRAGYRSLPKLGLPGEKTSSIPATVELSEEPEGGKSAEAKDLDDIATKAEKFAQQRNGGR